LLSGTGRFKNNRFVYSDRETTGDSTEYDGRPFSLSHPDY
jgi:hypothetical protein